MKKMSKLSIMCVILFVMVLMLTNVSFAAEGTIDFNSLLNTEEIEEENENNNSSGNSTTNDNATGNSVSGDNATGNGTTENGTTENSNTGDTSADKTNNSSQGDNTKTTTIKTVTDDSKLPQTGEKENIAVIVAVAVFGILAVVAYKNIKKYNVK